MSYLKKYNSSLIICPPDQQLTQPFGKTLAILGKAATPTTPTTPTTLATPTTVQENMRKHYIAALQPFMSLISHQSFDRLYCPLCQAFKCLYQVIRCSLVF